MSSKQKADDLERRRRERAQQEFLRSHCQELDDITTSRIPSRLKSITNPSSSQPPSTLSQNF